MVLNDTWRMYYVRQNSKHDIHRNKFKGLAIRRLIKWGRLPWQLLYWFEVVRIELLDRIECRYLDLEKEGFRLPVFSSDAQFLKPAHFDDCLIVRALVKEVPRARIDIFYEVLRGSNLFAEVILATRL